MTHHRGSDFHPSRSLDQSPSSRIYDGVPSFVSYPEENFFLVNNK